MTVKFVGRLPAGHCDGVQTKKRRRTKLVHEGKYVADVDVEVTETEDGWSPYLSLEEAYRLDDVREALRRGDVKAASR